MSSIQKTSGASLVGGSASSSGGSSAGGGNNTYSTEQGDFTATVTDSSNDIVLSVDSIGGESLAENHFMNGILKVYDASTEEVETITLDGFTWTSATKTLDTTNCTGAFTFATADVVSLTLTGPDKMRDELNDAMINNPIRDLSDQHQDLTFTLTNVPNATPDETILIDLTAYKGWSVHCEQTGGSDSFDVDYYVSNEGAESTDDWLEITPTFASGSASADHIAHPDSSMLVTKGLKLKVTTSDGGDDADFQFFIRLWF